MSNDRVDFLDGIKSIACILIVLLHSYSGGGGIDLAIRVITCVGVPAFMAVSGYLMFFREHKNSRFWLVMLKRYIPLFLFWFTLFVVFTYHLSHINPDEKSIFQYALENCDGWLYWYLEVLLEVLIVYPVIKVIVSNEHTLKYFIALWILMISLKQSLIALSMIVSMPGVFDILQLPFFQTKNYIGGSVIAHYPSECLGEFIALGLLIKNLLKNEVSRKFKMIVFILGILSVIYIVVGSKALLVMGMPIDCVMQPIQLQVVVLTLLFIIGVHKVCACSNKQVKRVARWISARSLGIYVIHPFVLPFASMLVSQFSLMPFVNTLAKATITVIFALALTCILKNILPDRVGYYLI